ANWVAVQHGETLADYNLDKSFSDLSGGSYAISITSGPLEQQATIISIGRDSLSREIRTLRVVYQNAAMGDIAIMGVAGVDVSGNNLSVEWGGIVSPNDITPNGQAHPSYWSAGNIVGYDSNGSALPNCDSPNCWWWHSYYKDVPPEPQLDFQFYKSSAQASGIAPCGKAYYQSGNMSGTCQSTNGKPFYIEGDWTKFNGPIVGTVIVMGNMTTPNGSMSGRSVDAPIPQTAWKQYCNDWSYYLSNYNTDATMSGTTQCPGIYNSYRSPSSMSYDIDPVVDGALYIGGDFTGPNGGGNSTLAYGALIVKGHVYLNSNSHVTYYYSSDAANSLQTTQIVLSRVSWQEEVRQWPAGL
ncbi:MAG: hypothetical protein KGK30_02340, partial [Elusimicrobia bacterium]|nr:hypothetical protein [Elusimicrobiota bacterium]